MSEIRWSFPSNNGGQIRGVADAGIETFNGSLIESIARETSQNSLDAVSLANNKCIIEIKCSSIMSSQFPGRDEFKEALSQTYLYWKDNAPKAKEYLEGAMACISAPTMQVLRISDFNTTGLLDPYLPALKSIWYSMTKIDGGSTKGKDKSGGFGIGKNAPYANSSLRTVFYRTLNLNNEIAAQGISRSISFPTDFTDEETQMETMTTGFGYYGNPDGNLPVETIEELDKIYKRDEIGTDLFIYGFKGDDKWQKSMIVEILNNFLVSIYRENLEVRVEDVIINKDNLDYLINTYIKGSGKKGCKTCYSNYLVLTSANKIEERKEFHGMGELKLSLLIDPLLELDGRILRTRKNGMKLFTSKLISKMIPCSGILEFDSKKLKDYFKDLEPPTHDRWDADRKTGRVQEAEQYIKEIEQWESDIVWKYGATADKDEINVTGLSDNLTSQESLGENARAVAQETIDFQLNNVEIISSNKTTKANGILHSNQGDGENKKEPTPGNLNDDNGKFGTVRTLKSPTHKRKSRVKHKGVVDNNGGETVIAPLKKGDKIIINSLRIFKQTQNLYKVTFILPYSLGRGWLEISSIGENNQARKFVVSAVRGVSNINNLCIKANRIEFDSIVGESKVTFTFELSDNKNYTMEVNIYEY